MKLTKEKLDELFKDNEVVRVRSGCITLGLTRDCMETALECLGDRGKGDWELLDVTPRG